MIYHTFTSSPLGLLLPTAGDEGLTGISFQDAEGAKAVPPNSNEAEAPFREATR